MPLKTIRIAAVLTVLSLITFMPFAPTKAQAASYVCDTTTFPAGDDSAFQMNVPFALNLGPTSYTQVYASINGVLSFGMADGTYWDYPATPSISVAGHDWVTWGQGAYLRYGTTADTLCIQWAVRPYPNSSGPLTYIDLKINRLSNGAWDGNVTSDGWLPDTLRRGIRYEQNQAVVTVSNTFSVNGGQPIQTHTCWNNEVIPVDQACVPEPAPSINTRSVGCSATNPYTQENVTWNTNQRYYQYWNDRTEDIDTVEMACLASTPVFAPPPPTLMTRQIPCTGTNPIDGSVANWTTEQRYNLFWDNSTEDIDDATAVCIASDPNLDNVDAVTVLVNGVELTVTVAEALELFNSPSDLLNALFTNPRQVATAILNIGADMTPETRKRSQRAIIPAVVVTQIISGTTAVTLVRRA